MVVARSNSPQTTSSTSTSPAGPNTLVQFTVTFDANGGRGTTPARQTVQNGESITLPDAGALTKIANIFNGWNTNVNGTGTSYKAGDSFNVTGTVLLYAQWTPHVYKIGDTGPSGGIIFYDKGSYSDGWRYLEAAPENTERSAPHYDGVGMYDNTFNGSRRLGGGKENTNKFITEFQRRGGGINTAPWLCNELDVNGFTDWYLPNADELLYMYNNLFVKGLGNLKNDIYWSSYVYRDIWTFIDYVDFADGSEDHAMGGTGASNTKHQVRAIRQF